MFAQTGRPESGGQGCLDQAWSPDRLSCRNPSSLYSHTRVGSSRLLRASVSLALKIDTLSESRLDSKPGCVKSAWESLDTVGSPHLCAHTSAMVVGPWGLLYLRPSWSSSFSPCSQRKAPADTVQSPPCSQISSGRSSLNSVR